VISKRRTAADGGAYGGQSFSRGALYQMLKNRVYRGEIVHKGSAIRASILQSSTRGPLDVSHIANFDGGAEPQIRPRSGNPT
jgi:hypothetical protein